MLKSIDCIHLKDARRALFVSFIALLAPSESVATSAPPKPNFVVILADDMGYADASCYGGTRYETPALDRLAREGMRFTDFHSSGAVCSPTRAGLLTGRYQQRASVPGVILADPKDNRHHGLQLSETTLAEVLKGAGYRTAVFGKWHLGYDSKYNPTAQGFDEFRGFVSGNIDYISHYDRMGIFDWWRGTKLEDELGYTTHLITKHAVRFIEEKSEQPFCLYIAHEAPHSPYQGPDDPPVRGPKAAKNRARGGKNARPDIRATYQTMMEEMDRGVGEVVDALRRRGVAENTLVFFFSDNGANRNGSNGPLRGFKGSLWEGGHRVPAIAWWPGVVKAGSVHQAPAISIDIFPTLVELAGARAPEELALDGISLAGTLRGEASPATAEPRDLFWEFGRSAAVRRGKWKLHVVRGKTSLFDLESDLGETRDLAAERPGIARELNAALEEWRKDVRAGATEQPARREALRAE